MTKKGPLGRAEKFYIENHLDKSVDDLSKDLDRAKSTIEKYLKTIARENQKQNPPKTKTRSKSTTQLYDQFARNRGSTVMTQNASEMSDQKRSEFKKNISRTNCVTNIRD